MLLLLGALGVVRRVLVLACGLLILSLTVEHLAAVDVTTGSKSATYLNSDGVVGLSDDSFYGIVLLVGMDEWI